MADSLAKYSSIGDLPQSAPIGEIAWYEDNNGHGYVCTFIGGAWQKIDPTLMTYERAQRSVLMSMCSEMGMTMEETFAQFRMRGLL